MNQFKVLAIIFAASLLAIACEQSSTPNVSNTIANTNKLVAKMPVPTPTTQADEMAVGKNLYSVNCAVCHKESGKGGKVTVEGRTIEPDDITTAKMAAKSDEKLFQYIDRYRNEGFCKIYAKSPKIINYLLVCKSITCELNSRLVTHP